MSRASIPLIAQSGGDPKLTVRRRSARNKYANIAKLSALSPPVLSALMQDVGSYVPNNYT